MLGRCERTWFNPSHNDWNFFGFLNERNERRFWNTDLPKEVVLI